jgi:hypothetical protein
MKHPQIEIDDFLSTTLDFGLTPFHPLVAFGDFVPTPDEVKTWTAPLYAVCCLEIFNHIAENATYRVCANETCRKTFVRQQGTATAGQYRTKGGVLYHTRACARAQAKREQRRRKRAERRAKEEQ